MEGFSKFLAALGAAPLWLFAGLTVFCGLFLFVPQLTAMLSPTGHVAFTVFGVLALVLFGSQMVSQWLGAWWKKYRAPLGFHLTPIPHLCLWGTAKQTDGSIVSTVYVDFDVKNRSDKPLRLVRARMIKPKFSGRPLQDLLLWRDWHEQTIPPQSSMTLRACVSIMGTPKYSKGPLAAVMAVADDDGNEQRIKLALRDPLNG
jgi:hypothetical protein